LVSHGKNFIFKVSHAGLKPPMDHGNVTVFSKFLCIYNKRNETSHLNIIKRKKQVILICFQNNGN